MMRSADGDSVRDWTWIVSDVWTLDGVHGRILRLESHTLLSSSEVQCAILLMSCVVGRLLEKLSREAAERRQRWV